MGISLIAIYIHLGENILCKDVKVDILNKNVYCGKLLKLDGFFFMLDA